jgi:hypothetical protein
MRVRWSHRVVGVALGCWFAIAPVRVSSQPAEPAEPAELVQEPGDAGIAAPAEDAAVVEDAATPVSPAPEEPPRGDAPVSSEAVVSGGPRAEAAEAPAAPEAPPSRRERATARRPELPAPLVVWATANWAHALGPARCGAQGLEGTETAIRIASTLAHSLASAGVGVAASGALGDHPLLAYAARERPAQLAELFADVGFSALVLGVTDLSGPLLREPALTQALRRRGILVIASNLECRGAAFCEAWATAEDPVPILERRGRRYALFSAFPDDLTARVEPAAGRQFELVTAHQTLLARTQEARALGADLIVATLDHGPDASASSGLAQLLSELPPDVRPDLLFSPSVADTMLLMRPLDVQPAVVGMRPSALTGVRVAKLADTNDSDVFARRVRLSEWNPEIARKLRSLGADYCHAHGAPLAGGRLHSPVLHEGFIRFAAQAVRAVARADLAVIDPAAYDPEFAVPRPTQLERGQVERAVLLDAPLVEASVTLEWLASLESRPAGLRPLALIGTEIDQGVRLIAGRVPMPGAKYRIVTSTVLARSGRLPDGAAWHAVGSPDATLRGALIAQLDVADPSDPRTRVADPVQASQWVLRSDGLVQANITSVNAAASDYDDPNLQVDESSRLGVQLVFNYDGDAPEFLFENRLQVGYDQNFETDTTAQDLIQAETTYTYRGLWPSLLLYPHPFVEGYVETQFVQGDAPYHPFLVRPEAGVRSMLSRVLSFKASAGLEYRPLDGSADAAIHPGVGAELVLKPSTIPLSSGALQVEGNISYFWNSPGNLDQHTLRGQVIGAMQLFGPLQFTLSVLGTMRKDRGLEHGKAIGSQMGLRLRFVDRSMSE